MTTKLAGPKTVFLPFNRGRDGGAGNPDDKAHGYRTAYLWHDVWERHAWLDILARFVHLEVKEEEDAKGRKIKKEAMIFPRFHQWDAVTRIERAVRQDGAGGNYLVQHSAGSGKSNSIAWLAHRLHSLHDAKDDKVFNSVVVITDRRVLDQQLQATVSQFESTVGVVQTIDDKLGAKSPRLAKALNENKPIIVCTLQSFAAVYGSEHEVLDQTGKRFAIIVDEAHSSQHGKAAEDLRKILGDADLEDPDPETAGDIDPFVLAAIKRKGPQKNLGFFAFTAYPEEADRRGLRDPSRRRRRARAVPYLLDAAGYRRRVHSRCAATLHHLQGLLPPLQGNRRRPGGRQAQGQARGRAVHEPASA
jgi:type I restriction enzyme R subunit